MASTVLRNVVVMILGVAVYALFLRYGSAALDSAAAGGRSRLLTLLGFHILFGVTGALIFRGKGPLRAGMVFLTVTIVGVGLEIVSPDPRHSYVQLFVALPFGAIAAAACLIFRRLRSVRNAPTVGDEIEAL